MSEAQAGWSILKTFILKIQGLAKVEQSDLEQSGGGLLGRKKTTKDPQAF